jgi:hypothetical protein
MAETSERTLFAEKDEFLALIAAAAAADSESDFSTLLPRVSEILDKYQEQASLLDRHLAAMVGSRALAAA